MFSKISFRRIFFFAMIVSFIWVITACNRKDNNVASNDLQGPETSSPLVLNFVNAVVPSASWSVRLPLGPVLRHNVMGSIYPDPKGTNLVLNGFGEILTWIDNDTGRWAWPPSPGFYAGYGWGSIIWDSSYFCNYWPGFAFFPHSFVDGDPLTGVTNPASQQSHPYPLQFEAKWETPQTIGRIYLVLQNVESCLCQYNYLNLVTPATNGTVVDIKLNPPIVTDRINLKFTPQTSGQVIGLYEVGVYRQTDDVGSLKIASPTTGNVFAFGETINFIASKTGTVSNIQWSSNLDGLIGNSFPTIATSGLRVGTHTITLSGQSSSGQTLSDSIAVGVTGGKPKVTKIDFKAMSGQNNLNRIYDRKGVHRQYTFLEPFQWKGKEVAGDIEEDYCWPVSYVRSSATSIGNDQSKLRIEATFKDMANSPSLSFDVQLVGKLYENGVFKQNLTFDSKSITTAGSVEKTEAFESTNGLPDVVGIWSLELEWQFSKSGTNIGLQRNPGPSTFQTVFTTWEKPLLTGNYKKDYPNPDGSKRCIELPIYYLEIMSLSCKYASTFGVGANPDDIRTKMFSDTWYQSGFKYTTEIKDLSSSIQGLDRLLRLGNGWCGEIAFLLQALIETQGVDMKYRGFQLKPIYYADHLLIIDPATAALGGVLPPAGQSVWLFHDHAVALDGIPYHVFDLTFQWDEGPFSSYVDHRFNIWRRIGPDTYDDSVSQNPATDGYIDVLTAENGTLE